MTAGQRYFPDAISTTSSLDWFLANCVCRELTRIWLPRELFRFHTSARKYCWPYRWKTSLASAVGFLELHENETTNDPAFEFTLRTKSVGPPKIRRT